MIHCIGVLGNHQNQVIAMKIYAAEIPRYTLNSKAAINDEAVKNLSFWSFSLLKFNHQQKVPILLFPVISENQRLIINLWSCHVYYIRLFKNPGCEYKMLAIPEMRGK